MAETEEELQSLLMKVKESWLKIQHSKRKVLASGPIASWQIDGETTTAFLFLGFKITADGDCSMQLKDAYSLEEKL